ncbi:MAG: MerR family DNA-binding transcriptional regulator, partial [Thiothrix sp.]|nr:MerR family DNA-binding transcriptional regulator [Thiothrix sp.]
SYTISELAKAYGITPRTVRLYEERGILNPQREGKRRIYSERDRVRLHLTLRVRRLGMSLAEARDLIDMYSHPQDQEHQLHRLLEKLHARRDKLLEQRRDIDLTLAEIERVCQSAQAVLDTPVS